MVEVLAFNRWSTAGITVGDAGLEKYITTQARIVPKTGARYAGAKFHKSKIFIVERLINKVMGPGHKGRKHWRSSGHMSGKAQQAHNIVEKALIIVEEKTRENPIKVLVDAIVNAAPREQIVTIEYGGARYPKATECAPQRRVDLSLRLFAQGAYAKSFNTKRKIQDCLAEEIVMAYKMDAKSSAIQKKLDVERSADAAR
ncbi:MAG: 30S ribosomal protein S7 [Nanoarchaeota archaeon]